MQLLQLLNSFVNSSATAPFRRQDQQELGETLTIAIKDSEEKQRKRKKLSKTTTDLSNPAMYPKSLVLVGLLNL